MKKTFCLIAVIIILTFSVCVVSAAGFSGGMRSVDEFSGGGFNSSTTATRLTYEALNDLCAEVNYGLQLGDIEFANGVTALTVCWHSYWEYYVIVGYYAGTTYVLCNNSGERYYALEEDFSETNELLARIYDLIDDCYKELVYLGSPLRDISSTLTTLSENLTTNFDTLFGYVDSVEIILNSINSHLDDTYLVVSYIYETLITIKSQFSNDIVPDVESIRANVANLYSWVWNIAQSEDDVLDTLTTLSENLTTLSTDLTTNFTTLFEYLDFLGTPDDETSSETVYGALLKNNDLINSLGFTLFSQRLPSIQKGLDNIYTRLGEIQDAVIDAGNINIDITNDNDAFNIFYITKTDGTTESVGEAATDAAKVVGEFLSVFYRLIFSDGMANADIIHDFESVYSTDGTGVNVW